MKLHFSLLASVFAGISASRGALDAEDADYCNHLDVDFIILEGDATILAIEDDIRADLEKVGVHVNLRALAKDDFNAAMVGGDFNFAFSETWGT